MGDLIVLKERVADRSRPSRSARLAFFFDLACPFSYLAAERVERVLGDVEWVPTMALPRSVGNLEALQSAAEQRASLMRLPMVWPDRFPQACPRALRAAAYAAELGAAPRFVLAASRLAFCGGFDLEDPEVLAEAAAAAGMQPAACLVAAGEAERDRELEATARGLILRGVRHLPAIRVERRWFDGERAVGEAAALLRAQVVGGGPLATAG